MSVHSSIDAVEVVEQLRRHATLGPQVAHSLFDPATPETLAELDPPLPPSIAEALAGFGVGRLWSHQVEAIDAVRRGDDVIVTTATASGKSLVFHLPVLEAVARGDEGTGLFLYPLKALGRDQLAKLESVAVAADLAADFAVYDGDTPPAERGRIRRKPPRVLITNPDMLHAGVLANWTSWTPFLERLRWIVLDELHTYRGVFGSHFHHVLARLRRICGRLGAEPRVIASSATASNAGEFARALTGRDMTWVKESGAPRQGRHLLLIQPATSPYTATLQLMVELLRRGLKTIVFTKARRITELLYNWLREQEPDLARRVASYRSGFLPAERRRIEAELFEGRLQGVISTSALEMGIDVGGLDACVLVGYPGSVMATWQRSGRVGREGRESITALVALPDALDQFYMAHPRQLIERPCEQLIVDPANELVSRAHLECAAAELPLSREDDADYLAAHTTLVDEMLEATDLLESDDGATLHARRARPHRDVGLRGGGKTYTIIHADRGRAVGTVDGVRVLHECHPGAIYLHYGRQYQVLELDRAQARVVARPVKVDWYTMPLTEKETEIVEILDEKHEGPLEAWLGRLRITERVVGFERRRIWGGERLDRHELELEPVRYETVGLWWVAPPEIESRLVNSGRHVMGSLHAAEHAAISLLPIVALCDRGDLGGISIPHHPQVGCGAVFVYDGHPGGIGIARRGFDDLRDLLIRVESLLESCDCDEGCPSCVQSPKCGNGNRPLDKQGARELLRLQLGLDPSTPGDAWSLRELPVAVEETIVEDPGPSTDEDLMPPLDLPADPEIEAAAAKAEQRPVSTAPQGPAEDRLQPSAPVATTPPNRGWRPATVRTEPDLGTLVFDIETLRSAKEVGGWHRVHRLGVAIAVVYRLETDEVRAYREDEVGELIADLDRAQLVVGYNSRRFDYRVLSGYTGVRYGRRWPTLDLFEQIAGALGRRISLSAVAGATLGAEKTADGLQSLEWVRQGRLDLVEAYCRADVEITRDLYLFGRREGFVRYPDREGRLVRLPVSW